MAKAIKIAEGIQVKFGGARILPSGEVGTMTITQGEGDDCREIVLTPEQARSLARTIREKFGVDGQ